MHYLLLINICKNFTEENVIWENKKKRGFKLSKVNHSVLHVCHNVF